MSKSRFTIQSQNNTENLNSNRNEIPQDNFVRIESEWQHQMALKNEAILKSIEELIDRSLKQTSD